MKSTQNAGRQGLSGAVAALTVGLVLSGATAQNKVEKSKAKAAKEVVEKTAEKAAEKSAEKGAAQGVVKDAAGARKPSTDAAASAAQDSAAPKGPQLARIESESVQVRCFASIHSPVYEGSLSKGTVVVVGDATGEFRRVQLPIGVVGFVSKKFTTQPKQGLVTTTGAGVSFRYRPTPLRRAEQPVSRLKKGTSVKYLGEQGDWWKVRLVTDSAYLPIKEIAVFETANATLQKSEAELRRLHQTEWNAATKAYEDAVAAVALQKAQANRYQELRQAYNEELRKPEGSQQFDALMTDVTTLLAQLPKDKPLWAGVERLQGAVKTQQVVKRAKALLATKPPPAKEPKVTVLETPADPLARLQHIGWLRQYRQPSGAVAFQLTKGGRAVCTLRCASLRFDLSMYLGAEIGVVGSTRHDEQASYVEVAEIVVLGQGH